MNNIEDLIKSVCQNDIDIPIKIQNRIKYTLQNKRKSKNYLRNFIMTILSIIGTLIGSFCVYAATGGTIEGIPATDWLGIKFSSQYVEYKQPVENQIAAFGDTSVELTSTLCNEGITILEFDVKLSEEDYKKLKIGENVLTDEYLQIQNENKSKLRDLVTHELKNKIYTEEFNKGNYEISEEDIVVPEKDIDAKYEEKLSEIEELIEERKNTSFLPALSLNYDQKGGTYTYDKWNPNMDWYASIYIDDTPYYVRNWQKIEKISDYEYKIYTMYSLTDDELQGKEEFKITLKNNKLASIVKWSSLPGWRNDCQWFAANRDGEMMKTPDINVIDLPGDFEVNVSKNAVLKDSKVIENPEIKSEFRNITHTVEKIVASPLQTIVKINHSATKQSSNAFASKYPGKPDIEHLPMTREYKVYDANGKELTCFATSNKHTLIYSDGRREDYDSHDIPNKKYSNATWETVEYLLIENTDTDFIKIVPVETIRNPVEETDDDYGEIYYEMEPLMIQLSR